MKEFGTRAADLYRKIDELLCDVEVAHLFARDGRWEGIVRKLTESYSELGQSIVIAQVETGAVFEKSLYHESNNVVAAEETAEQGKEDSRKNLSFSPFFEDRDDTQQGGISFDRTI